MKKSTKLIALFTILAMCVTMMSACVGGRTYEELAGSIDAVNVAGKDEVVEVPYTGDPIIEYIEVEGDIIEIVEDDGEDDEDDGDDGSDDGSDNNGGDDSGNNGGSNNSGGDDSGNSGGTNNNGSSNNNGGENSGNGGEGSDNSEDDSDNEDDFDEEEFDFTSDYPKYKDADILKILSQNVRCVSDVGDGFPGTTLEERHLRIKDEIEKVDPDLIGFQEVRPAWLNLLVADHSKTYDYYHCFRASGLKTGEDGDECSAVFWKKDRFERLDAGEFWLSPTPDQVSKFPVATDQHRICNWVKLKNKETGKQFVFASVHYSTDAEPRLLSADVMNSQLKKIAGKLPIICVGDYNMEPNSTPYNALLAGGVLGDLNAELAFRGWNDGYMDSHTTGGGYKTDPSDFNEDGEVVKGGQIDYIMISMDSTGLYPLSYKVLQEKYGGNYVSDGYVSDHFGVYGEVVIPSAR